MSTGHPIATSAGCAVLDRGGNAVDAAVAAAYALMVVLPHACGPGGDAFILVRHGASTVAFNGSGAIPRRWVSGIPVDGAAAATVPGAVAALDDAHREFGRVGRADVLSTAIGLARDGFAVTDDLAAAITRNRARLLTFAPGAPFARDLQPGVVLRQPQLAEVLEGVSACGADSFYAGPNAQALVDSAQVQGSVLGADDLVEHATVRADAIRIPLGNAVVALTPPVSQAVLAGITLDALARTAAEVSGHGRVHLLIEAMESAFQHRSELATLPWQDVAGRVPPPRGGPARRLGGAQGTSHTSAVAVADADGLVVSMLVSIFHEFGSAGYIPELGFVLNDRMRGLEIAPARDGRPLHTLSPAILELGDEVLGLATPGADAQVQVLAQVVDGLLADGLTLPQAIDRPRWRLQGRDLVVESSMPVDLRDALRAFGHNVEVIEAGHRSFGSMVAAGHTTMTGTCFGTADLRRESTAGAA